MDQVLAGESISYPLGAGLVTVHQWVADDALRGFWCSPPLYKEICREQNVYVRVNLQFVTIKKKDKKAYTFNLINFSNVAYRPY